MLSLENKKKLVELKDFLEESENFIQETLEELGLDHVSLHLLNSIPAKKRYAH